MPRAFDGFDQLLAEQKQRSQQKCGNTYLEGNVDADSDAAQKIKRALGYKAFPKQEEFHHCGAKYRLFGGAAGPGKSKALLMEAIAQALDTPGSNTLLLRRSFPELEGTLLLYFRRDVPRELYASFNEAKHTVTWRNGSTTRFGYSQNENDIYQYQSSEFLFIGIDELTHFTLRQWQFLTSRNRCPVPGSRPCMAGATNPGNIGHAWVKSLFIDKQSAPGMEPREYDANDYAFISARVWDNPIYANDPSYIKSLQQLPDFYRRAFLDGDWSVFAGQYFTNFDPSRSVIRAERIAAAAWWPRWISIDWGFEHPAAVYWHTTGPVAPASLVGSSVVGEGLQTLPGEAKASPLQPLTAASTCPEDQRHRLDERQTRDAALRPSANNLTFPKAGDAAPFEFHQQAGRTSCVLPGSPNAGFPAFGAEADAPASLSANDSVGALPQPPRPASPARDAAAPPAQRGTGSQPVDCSANCHATTITYREFIAQHLSPRVLAAQIIERSRARDGSTEKIDAVYLSPDAFARRTDESSIAEQIGDILAASGLPRPVPADNDRIGGWMLMYQMLDAGEWLIADSCPELIRTLPELVRDESNVEDIAKHDGDDAADAARYGLKSRASSRPARPPREQEFEQRVTSSDPTIRAIQAHKAELELPRKNRPVFAPWSRWRRR
jgi:hypothetical protein